MADRVRPLKMEYPEAGGTQTDEYPTGLNPHEDHVDCRGIFFQDDSSSDEAVGVSRDASGNMTFHDDVLEDTYTLSQLTTGGSGLTPEQHRILRQLIHFIDEGPAEGFATGAYKEILPAGNPFPTSEIWWDSSGKTKKIVELAITRDAGQKPTTEVWTMYDADGNPLATVTDTITYSGVFETTRTRAIA